MAKNDKPAAKPSGGPGTKKPATPAPKTKQKSEQTIALPVTQIVIEMPKPDGAAAATTSPAKSGATHGLEVSSNQDGLVPADSPPLRIADTPAVELADTLRELADELAVHIGAIHVTVLSDGYRRAGRAWSRQPTVVLLTDLTDEQLLQLADDPNVTMTPASDAQP